MSERPISILIVDDSALYRQSIQNVMRDIPGTTVVGVARNGVEALEKVENLDPDLLTLDVQMPDMDGIEVLRNIKSKGLRAKAIMLSSFTSAGAQVTTDALMEGAFDFILKPSSNDSLQNRQHLHDSLQEKIQAFCQSILHRKATNNGVIDRERRGGSPRVLVPSPERACQLVLMGASTGGPAALKQVLPKFPASTPAPIVVVQHMPAGYTTSLAQRLNEQCPCEVIEASDGMELRNGRILLAAGGRQMKLAVANGKLIARLTDDPPIHGVRPSVDVLMNSTVDVLGGAALAVILTGMGRDGLQGCRALKEAGGFVFAQSQEDCVVYGMPKAVAEHGLVDRMLTLPQIAPAVLRHIKRSQRSH